MVRRATAGVHEYHAAQQERHFRSAQAASPPSAFPFLGLQHGGEGPWRSSQPLSRHLCNEALFRQFDHLSSREAVELPCSRVNVVPNTTGLMERTSSGRIFCLHMAVVEDGFNPER